MKAVTVILAALALQVVAAATALSGEDGNANQVGADLSDKPSLELLGLVGLEGPIDLDTQKLNSKQFIDVTGVIRALQNILNAINEQVQSSANALSNAIASALRQAETVVQNTVDSWNQRLQAVADDAARLNATLAECQARQPSLQSVRDALRADVQECVRNASASAQAALDELTVLGPQAQALLDRAEQDIASCESAGLFQGLCVAGRLPALGLQGAGLAANATRLGAHIAAELVVRLPLRGSACVARAAGSRSAEALRIVDAIRRCVRDSAAPTTASPAK